LVEIELFGEEVVGEEVGEVEEALFEYSHNQLS